MTRGTKSAATPSQTNANCDRATRPKRFAAHSPTAHATPLNPASITKSRATIAKGTRMSSGMPMTETARTTHVITRTGTNKTSAAKPIKPALSGSVCTRPAMPRHRTSRHEHDERCDQREQRDADQRSRQLAESFKRREEPPRRPRSIAHTFEIPDRSECDLGDISAHPSLLVPVQLAPDGDHVAIDLRTGPEVHRTQYRHDISLHLAVDPGRSHDCYDVTSHGLVPLDRQRSERFARGRFGASAAHPGQWSARPDASSTNAAAGPWTVGVSSAGAESRPSNCRLSVGER